MEVGKVLKRRNDRNFHGKWCANVESMQHHKKFYQSLEIEIAIRAVLGIQLWALLPVLSRPRFCLLS